MRKWWVKAAIQGTLSRLPATATLNRAFQRRVTGSLAVNPAQLREKWLLTLRHVDGWRAADPSGSGFTALEIGTGWHPIASLALVAAGATTVQTVDRQSLLDPETTRSTLVLAADGIERGTLPNTVEGLAQRFRDAATMSSPIEMMRAAGVELLVGDLQSLALAPGSVDLSITNNTLEHIPEPQLRSLFDELRRLAGQHGVSCHFIDLADHYSHFDQRLTPFHFLRFSDRRWRVFNNDLQYQNRLRAPDYRRLFAERGLPIVDETTESGEAADLPARLASEFRCYGADDLLVHSMWVVCRRDAARIGGA